MTDQTPEPVAQGPEDTPPDILSTSANPYRYPAPPQPPLDQVAPGAQPNPKPFPQPQIDEHEARTLASSLNGVADQTRITAARNKHAALKAASDQAANELAAVENRGRPAKRPEPVFGDVSTPHVPEAPTPEEPNKGLRQIKSMEEVKALIHAGHKVRSADMPADYWFSIQRRKGRACYVLPVTEDSERMLLRDGKTYYLLPD